jgi:micrococcal nuclease
MLARLRTVASATGAGVVRHAMRAMLASWPLVSCAQSADSVWVNTRSGTYHCRGTEYYGKTTRGEYLSEGDAMAKGYRANGGRTCNAVPGGLAAGARRGPKATEDSREPCVLERITDGDTIRCEGSGSVRLIGIDAPEVRLHEPYAARATDALRALAAPGDVLALEFDTERRDRGGRLLAYVWKGDEMLNLRLVGDGHAVSYRFRPNTRHAASLDSAEQSARRAGAGEWSDPRFVCLPLASRRPSC